MKVQKFSFTDAKLVKSPGQDAEIYVGNLVDEKNGGPVTIGCRRYAPGQSLTETMAVDYTMIVLEGQLSVSTGAGTVTAGPGALTDEQCEEVRTALGAGASLQGGARRYNVHPRTIVRGIERR